MWMKNMFIRLIFSIFMVIAFIFAGYIEETKAAPNSSPVKPYVNIISNKDVYITGKATINSTVFVEVNKEIYSQNLKDTNLFKIALRNKPLIEGSMVKVYIIDSQGRKSSEVWTKVIDKIPPKRPTVNKVTDKSYSITGTAEVGTITYITRNSKHYGALKPEKSGKYVLPIPLHQKGTIFEVYSIDKANNKSSSVKVVVAPQSRPAKKILYAPLVKQMPELPRGCEVTSLTMLLNYTGIKVNKMTLAKQVKKDPTPYKVIKGKKYFGNPNYGFVGNMYTFGKPGFGVFNKPIESLAKQYKPNRIVNLSGQSFDAVLNYVGSGHPVWIINTSWFSYVPSQYWQIWYTPQGPVRITMKEHSVLVTGYDSKYVYFNDPLDGTKNKKRPMKQFIEGWKQYGSQAISYF
jgi:uncharacterized protein YvpB